jgi:outer membrane cobalamin receptor
MARRLNSDVTSRQLLGAATLDDDAVTAVLRASTQALDRGLAGSIVQPSMTGREGETRQDAGFDASWRRASFAFTSAGSLTYDRATYRDPSPPLGTPYDDTVNASGMNASSTIAFGAAPLWASAGAELRAMSVTSTALAPGAPRWQRLSGVFGGLRASRRVDSAGTRVGIDADARLDESSLTSGATLSPALVASVSRRALNASVTAGSGYSPPSLADQFFHEGVLIRPNPGLRPERTRNDLEARIEARDVGAGPLRLSAEAAAFRADIDDMILWLPDFRFIWSPSNYAVRRAGWEASGQASLPAARVDLQGTLNRADVAYAGPVLTGQVAYRPRTTGSVTLAGGPAIARIELTSRYVGARRTVAGSPLNALDPYWLTTLRATSTLVWRAWRFDASTAIENLFNRPAAMLVDYPFPTRGWTVSLRVRRADVGQPPR